MSRDDCIRCNLSEGAFAPNDVCAPYDRKATAFENYRFYETFCRYHGLKFYDYDAWMNLGNRDE